MRQLSKKHWRKGFTLLEVLVVVVIAVLVTMFAVPSYRKAQERNRYMAAVGVLIDMGNAVRMFQEDYPNVIYTGSFTSSSYSSCPTEPVSSTVRTFLLCHKYLTEIPFSSSQYQGYSYKISTSGAASCSGCSSYGVACMYDSDALVSEYRCAYIDRNGNLHNN